MQDINGKIHNNRINQGSSLVTEIIITTHHPCMTEAQDKIMNLITNVLYIKQIKTTMK